MVSYRAEMLLFDRQRALKQRPGLVVPALLLQPRGEVVQRHREFDATSGKRREVGEVCVVLNDVLHVGLGKPRAGRAGRHSAKGAADDASNVRANKPRIYPLKCLRCSDAK